HLRIAEVGFLLPVRTCAQGPDEVRLARAGLPMKQQDTCLRRAILRYSLDERCKFAACLRMHLLDVHRVSPPDIVFPGDRMLESLSHPIRCDSFLRPLLHKTLIP